jgi:hypothetical protein
MLAPAEEYEEGTHCYDKREEKQLLKIVPKHGWVLGVGKGWILW